MRESYDIELQWRCDSYPLLKKEHVALCCLNHPIHVRRTVDHRLGIIEAACLTIEYLVHRDMLNIGMTGFATFHVKLYEPQPRMLWPSSDSFEKLIEMMGSMRRIRWGRNRTEEHARRFDLVIPRDSKRALIHAKARSAKFGMKRIQCRGTL